MYVVSIHTLRTSTYYHVVFISISLGFLFSSFLLSCLTVAKLNVQAEAKHALARPE